MSLDAAAIPPPDVDPLNHVAMRRVLIVGLLIRIGIFALASPFNRDRHLEVIDWLLAHHALPPSNVLQQSYHPPLYYLLAAPIRWISPATTWPLHLFSLACSAATLVWIRQLFDDPLLLAIQPTRSIRVAAFALVATSTQLAMFGSFISNDPLAQLVGVALFASVIRYVRVATSARLAWLTIAAAAGLLTKGTFLLAGIALAPIVLRREWPRGARRAAGVTLAFCLGWLALGSYKYVDNVARFGRPFVHNQEILGTPTAQRTIWRGPQTIYDLDVGTLVRHPVVRPGEPTSYPLTLYATFWYAHLGDSSFRGNVGGYDWIGSATYGVAVVPTFAFVLGCAGATASLGRWVRRGQATTSLVVASLTLFVANVAVVVAAGVRFDVWEAFQGRLLFGSLMPIVVLFLAGTSRLPPFRTLRVTLLAACWATAACGVLYFAVEFALARHLLPVDESELVERTRMLEPR